MRKRSGRPPRYAAVPNETIDDAVQLDFMALALLTILLRHRDGWDITLKRIGHRYGYGEEAMAGAMGLLQAARYVVKVRYQRREGNQWATEVAVYDVPATDDEVDDLLAAIEEENPDARRIEVIPPTKTAIEKAAKRRTKIVPRLREFRDSGPTWGNTVKPQVGPESGVSRDSGDPGVTKKTNSKKNTNSKNPPDLRPSVPAGSGVREAQAPAARTDGRGGGIEEDQEDGPGRAGGRHECSEASDRSTGEAEQGGGEKSAAAEAGGAAVGGVVRLDSPGARLLMKAADRQTLTDLRVQGTALRDQALMVDGLLEAGHSPWTIHEVIALPMPDPVKTSRSAVISGRLKRLAGTAPVALPSMSAGAPQETPVPGPRWEDSPTPTAPNWTDRKAEQEQLRHGVELNPGCAGDEGLCPVLAVVGETLCPTHLGWPLCPGHDGRTCTTRTRTGEQCATCAHDAFYARLDAELPVIETEDGTCPGYDGPCGRGVVMMGLCPRCRMASQADRDRIEAEFDAARAAAVAAIAADEGHTGEQEQPAERVAEGHKPQEEAEGHRAAAFAVELDEESAYREAVERAERAEQDRERTARERAADEETARLRAELAAQFPDLAAVSGSVREAQEAQQPALSPF